MTPRELLQHSIRSEVAPALASFGYAVNPSADRLTCIASEITVTVKFQGNHWNRGSQSRFTSSWWVSSARFGRWRKDVHPEARQPSLLFARNDWLLPGWPLDALGFSPTQESQYDQPSVKQFIIAARDVAVPLFASLLSPEQAAKWALGHLEPLDRELLLAFLAKV